jgi:GTP-binding protein HflX
MLQALLRQRVPQDRVAAADLLLTLAHLAHALRREVGVYVDRHGTVREVVISRRWQELLPVLAARASATRLAGVRYLAARPEAEGAPAEGDRRHLIEARLDMAVVMGSRKGTPTDGWLLTIAPGPDGAPPLTGVEGPYPAAALAHLEALPRIKAVEGALRRSRTVIAPGARPERAVLVGLALRTTDGQESGEAGPPPEASLDELARLTETAGAVVGGRTVQTRARPDPGTFVGRGKVEAVRRLCEEEDADLVVFDVDLTPAQQRNLERELGRKVLDRTALVLDIFARRAHTREGRLQVELAQLTYLLPRLAGRGIWLSRLGGGIGTRGPGETKLEVDRRRIRQRITALHGELQTVTRHRILQRAARRRGGHPVAAITGYTNAGKSTLLNALTRAGVLVEDKLFATLDPTVRRVALPNHQTILLVDTVGFIHKLPTHLVAAFRATLEEAVDADLLVHVVDVSDPQWRHQMAVVNRVLTELGAGDRPQVLALNKIDRLSAAARQQVHAALPEGVLISAQHGVGLVNLLRRIGQRLPEGLIRLQLALPYTQAGALAQIYAAGRVLAQRYEEQGIVVDAEVPPALAARLRRAAGDA